MSRTDYHLQWEHLYRSRFANLGNTATIVPLVDAGTAINTTTFPTRVDHANGSSQTVTWSAAPSALGTPFKEELVRAHSTWLTPGLYGPAGIPLIKLNGSSEGLTIPDAGYWTRGNGAADSAFSVIGCLVVPSTAEQMWFAKNAGTGSREYDIYFTNGKLNIELWDDSAAAACARSQDAALSLNVPHHCVVTYDGSGGATAGNGITLYMDGTAAASTASNNASYVAMEDLTAAVRISGYGSGPGSYYAGSLFGGAFGPTFVQAQLTAAQVLNDYRQFRGAVGLG